MSAHGYAPSRIVAAHLRDAAAGRAAEIDGVRVARVELGRVGVVEAADVARELDRTPLHAEADAEERHLALAGVADRLDLALDAAPPKPPGTRMPSTPRDLVRPAPALDLLGVDVDQLDLRQSLAMPAWISAS